MPVSIIRLTLSNILVTVRLAPQRCNPAAALGTKLRTTLRRALTELRQDLFLVEVEEGFLVRSDLLDVDLVVAGVGELTDHLPVRLGVGAAGHGLRDHLLGDQLGGLLEVGRCRQDRGELAGEQVVRPEPVGGLAGLRFVLTVADLKSAVGGFVAAARGAEEVQKLGVGDRVYVAVADPRGEAGRLGTEAGDEDRGRLVREGVDPGVLDPVVLALVVLRATLPQKAYDLYSFLEHLQAHVRGRPRVAEDVLVKVLAASDAELEAPR